MPVVALSHPVGPSFGLLDAAWSTGAGDVHSRSVKATHERSAELPSTLEPGSSDVPANPHCRLVVMATGCDP
jgi:hypothetical protein